VHVPQTLVQTITQVHVANRVDALGELNGARQLAVPVAPVVLDALQMPLINNYDDFVASGLVNLIKQLLVLVVN
jgi:hypothetical protein